MSFGILGIPKFVCLAGWLVVFVVLLLTKDKKIISIFLFVFVCLLVGWLFLLFCYWPRIRKYSHLFCLFVGQVRIFCYPSLSKKKKIFFLLKMKESTDRLLIALVVVLGIMLTTFQNSTTSLFYPNVGDVGDGDGDGGVLNSLQQLRAG